MNETLEATIAFRDKLLANNWPDDFRVAGLMGEPADADPTPYGVGLRADGVLLGVWSAPARRFVHPAFQFDTRGRIRLEVAELLKVLPDTDDRGGWQRAFWLYSPHSLLEGRTPANVFEHEPQRVIGVARLEFEADPNAGW